MKIKFSKLFFTGFLFLVLNGTAALTLFAEEKAPEQAPAAAAAEDEESITLEDLGPVSEDLNGNGVLDPGEDANGNGKLDVYDGDFSLDLGEE